MAKTRTANAPDIPTVDEAGAPGLHMAPWQAIWAPKGTPKDSSPGSMRRSSSALADPAMRKRLAEQATRSGRARSRRRRHLGAFHKAEIDKWWPIIKAAGIKGG